MKSVAQLSLILAAMVAMSAGAFAQKTLQTSKINFVREWKLNQTDDITSQDKAGIFVTIDVPNNNQNPALANAIMTWAKNVLFQDYKGSLSDPNDWFNAWAKHNEANENELQVECTVEKVYETSKFVSFEINGYDMYIGGAHGNGYCIGATFRKSDGKLFGKNMFRNPTAMRPLIKAGLTKYFCEAEGTPTVNLKDCLLDVDNVNKIPLPSNEPWITSKGLNFVYQPYEIACYAAGLPAAIVPISKALPYMTTQAKALVK